MGKHALKPIPRDGVGQCIRMFDVSLLSRASGPNKNIHHTGTEGTRKHQRDDGWARRGAIFHYGQFPSRNLHYSQPARPDPGASPASAGRMGGRARPAFLSRRADAAAPMAGAGGKLGPSHRSAGRAASGAGPNLPPAPPGTRYHPAIVRRDPEVSLAPRGWGSHRVGAHSLRQPANAVHLVAGRVRPQVLLLRHRPHGVPAQPDAVRDRGTGAGDRAAEPGGEADQHRLHGNGRAAAQLARGGRRAQHPQPSGWPRHRRPAHHRVHRRDPARAWRSSPSGRSSSAWRSPSMRPRRPSASP